MAFFLDALDSSELKMQRASERERCLMKKRSSYERSQGLSISGRSASAAPLGRDHCNPHRLTRAATRAGLARGLIQTCTDMPAISMGRGGHWKRWVKKPSVSPLILCPEKSTLAEELELDPLSLGSDAETEAGDADAKYLATDSSDEDGCYQQIPSFDTASSVSEAKDQLVDQEEKEKEKEEPRNGDGKKFEGALMPIEADKMEAVIVQSELSVNEDEILTEQHVVKRPRTREEVLREVMEARRLQVCEAEAAALAAIARAEKAEQKVLEHEQRLRKQHGPGPTAKIKEAMQLEKHLAAEQRKKRNLDAHRRALQKTAEETLQKAQEARDSVEAEAATEKARLLAEAHEAAKVEAEALVRAEMALAQAEAETLVQDGLAKVASTEADMRLRVEAEAKVAREQCQNEAHTAMALAEAEARAVRERAEANARVLKARVEGALRAKAEADACARQKQEAQAQAQAAAEAASRAQAEAEAQRRADAVAFRQARELEQQRAKHFRRQAQLERREEQTKQQELTAARIRAEEEGRAAWQRAMAEANAAKETAEAKARQIEAKVLAEAQAKAENEARALREDAEAEARAIKNKAEEEARVLKAQAEEALQAAKKSSSSCNIDENESESGWELLSGIDSVPSAEGGDWDIVA